MVADTTRDPKQLRQACKKALHAKNFANAAILAESYCANFPMDPAGAILLVLAHVEMKNYDVAISLLEEGQRKFPTEPQIPFLLAVIYQDHLSRHRLTEQFLRRALELKPHWPQANLRLGIMLSKADRKREAIPHLKVAAELFPEHFPATYLLANALHEEGYIQEAVNWMERAYALHPDNSAVKYDVDELRGMTARGVPRTGRIARWPSTSAEFVDLKPFIREYLLNEFDRQDLILKPGMTVLTQGSCFATNLAESFSRFDLKVGTIPMGEEHNSTFANREVIRWLRDGVVDETTEIVASNLGAENRDKCRAFMQQCDIYVYTLGVAPAFFHKATEKFSMPRQSTASAAALMRNNTFRTTTVAENSENLRWMINVLREFNPTAKVILTVSPVPLKATPEMSSAIMADCISKSTLRVAVHELIQAQIQGVLYWPSFEIVRWIGGHVPRSVYGTDDRSANHVDLDVIDIIVDCFIETFGDSTLIPVKANHVRSGEATPNPGPHLSDP